MLTFDMGATALTDAPSVTGPADSDVSGMATGLAAEIEKAMMRGDVESLTPEALQAQIETEAATQRQKLEQEAFNAALKQLLPLSTQQIRDTYEAFAVSREAAETPIRDPEKHKRVETVSLDPSSDSPVIRLVPGYVTTISILDSTGAPWPIQDMTFAGKFDIEPPESGGHVVRMMAKSAHGVGNMSVRLVDLITPVIFTLQTSLVDVDYRLDVRIPKPGPLAKTQIMEAAGGLAAIATVAGADTGLSAVLDGTPPSGAEKLVLQGVDGRTSAWRINGKLYLRTSLTLLSPAWDSSMSSADGTSVYTLKDTPVVLLSDNGKMYRASLLAGDRVTP